MNKIENYKDVLKIAVKILIERGIEKINLTQKFMIEKDCLSLAGKSELYITNYFKAYDIYKYLLAY